MNIRLLLIIICAMCAGLAIYPSSGFAGTLESKPNIIVVLVDDLGYGDLSCLGAKDMRTPHIDNIAKAGSDV